MEELLENVFKNIDSKIFESKEVKDKLSEAFANAVNEKAEVKAKDLFEAQEATYTKTLEEMIEVSVKSIKLDLEEKFDEEVKSKVTEITEAYSEKLDEEVKSNFQSEIEKLSEVVEKYLDLASKEFVTEAMPIWESEVKINKAEKIIENFTSLSESFGIQVSKLDESDETKKLNESLDKAIEREKLLNEKIDLLVKDGLLKEAKEKLTAIQSDKLDKLMESVPFVDGFKYKAKLDMYVGVVADNNKEIIVESQSQHGKKLPWSK